MEERGITQIVLAARGTSDHAAVFGQYLFQIVNHLAAFLATPSIVTLYNSRVALRNTLVIGISQSGQARDSSSILRRLASRAAPRCHYELRGLAARSDGRIGLTLDAGQERSVAATKTYTASLLPLRSSPPP